MSVTQVVASSSPPPPPPPPVPAPAAAAAVHGPILPNLAAMDKDPAPSPARLRNLPGGDTVAFPNGTLKRHNPARPRSPPPSPPGFYRECLKNHAASLGGHALDGCGEFMPSPLAVPSDPSSLKCSACGCHRNFHRRDDDPAAGDLTPKRRSSSSASPPRPPPAPPISSPYFTSAPHMLLALSTGAGGGAGPAQSAAPIGRKRFRTKFSREQKERMLLFAEKLGWRMQKQEEKLVEDFCNEIGVAKGVLKVWMHNNKHAFVKKDQRQQLLHGNGNGSFNNESANGFDTNKTNGTTTTTHVFNGSSSSS